ncbi:MAG: diaminopimelate decarboxylase [Dehalococcoidia bacterium]
MPGSDILNIFPMGSSVTSSGHLNISNIDITELANERGTPLYIFDENTIRTTAKRFNKAFSDRYADVQVVYACKAWSNVAILQILEEEGLGFDVVSGEEISTVEAARLNLGNTFFHGNNKSRSELLQAVVAGVGRIVVDNSYELDLLEEVLQEIDKKQEVLFRVSPGVDPHTHSKTTTGVLDSKFGIPIETGEAEKIIIKAMESDHIIPKGLHFHLGSPIFELSPYEKAIAVAFNFASEMKQAHGFIMEEFSPGGGFASKYLVTDEVPDPEVYADTICNQIKALCASLNLELPKLTIEPGRSIISRAGIAVYRTGVIKEIPGIRTYVSVDGGMGDNIRPAIYDAKYEAALITRMDDEESKIVTISGKYCESGDILVKDYNLPSPRPDELLAIPASGAYALAMASNYNGSRKPEAVLLKEGAFRVIRRRETIEDILKFDVV